MLHPLPRWASCQESRPSPRSDTEEGLGKWVSRAQALDNQEHMVTILTCPTTFGKPVSHGHACPTGHEEPERAKVGEAIGLEPGRDTELRRRPQPLASPVE